MTAIQRVRERIALACSKVKRNPDSITIVAISKARPVEQIKEAVGAGITDIGENRVQEALIKYNAMRSAPCPMPKWHMVGHLQANKVKEAVRIFDLIQSVDSLALAQEIDKQAAKINKIQNILVEIKTSPEATKFGLKPEEAAAAIEKMAQLKNIRVQGLMTIAPLVDDPEKTRPYFRMLKELYDNLNLLSAIRYPLSAISMGMSDDFEIAIEEGANMVRLGRAIFADNYIK